MLIDRGFEKGGQRFPRADAFSSMEAAALECDFWKLVLLKRFFLVIPFSHGSLSEYLDAATQAGRNPLADYSEETAWSEELKDFIACHNEKLAQHREVNKPKIDLDGLEVLAKSPGNYNGELYLWVLRMREAQEQLAQFEATQPGQEIERLRTLIKYITLLVEARMPERHADIVASVQSLRPTLKLCIDELRLLEDKKHSLELALETLKSITPSTHHNLTHEPA